MQTQTTNYGFIKDDGDEFYNVLRVNANLDKIDAEIKNVDEKVSNIDIDDLGAVPTTRKVNNKALSSDITLNAGDIKTSENKTIEETLQTHASSLGEMETEINNGTSILIPTGTANNITLPVTLVNGKKYSFKASANSTATVTINGKAFKKLDGTVIGSGGVKTNKVYDFYYDSIQDCVFNLAKASGNATVADVLVGSTFSNEDGSDLVGTLTSIGYSFNTGTTEYITTVGVKTINPSKKYLVMAFGAGGDGGASGQYGEGGGGGGGGYFASTIVTGLSSIEITQLGTGNTIVQCGSKTITASKGGNGGSGFSSNYVEYGGSGGSGSSGGGGGGSAGSGSGPGGGGSAQLSKGGNGGAGGKYYANGSDGTSSKYATHSSIAGGSGGYYTGEWGGGGGGGGGFNGTGGRGSNASSTNVATGGSYGGGGGGAGRSAGNGAGGTYGGGGGGAGTKTSLPGTGGTGFVVIMEVTISKGSDVNAYV